MEFLPVHMSSLFWYTVYWIQIFCYNYENRIIWIYNAVPNSQRSGTAYCPPLAQREYPRPFWFKTLSYRRQALPCSQYAPLRGGTCHSPFSKCFHRSFLMNRIRIAGRSLSLQLYYSYHGGCTCRACLFTAIWKSVLGYWVFCCQGSAVRKIPPYILSQ